MSIDPTEAPEGMEARPAQKPFMCDGCHYKPQGQNCPTTVSPTGGEAWACEAFARIDGADVIFVEKEVGA